MKLTQKDIAAMLGVDRSTISRALQDSPRVAPELRERIKSMCRELGYMPDYFASRLSGGGTHQVSVIRPGHYTVSELHTRWLCGIMMAADASGYRARPDEGKYCERVVAERSADGLILVGGIEEHYPGLMSLWTSGRFPMVLTDCPPNPATNNKVLFDNRKAVLDAVNHLATLGHRRIAFFGNVGMSALSRERLNGYMHGMGANGLPIHPSFIMDVDVWVQEADEAFAHTEALRRCVAGDGATGIICNSDIACAGVIKVLGRMGLSVPGDVSVTGFDDSLLARAWDPQMTTIRQDVTGASRTAVSMLIELIRTGVPQADIVLATELLVRGTTGPVKAGQA